MAPGSRKATFNSVAVVMNEATGSSPPHLPEQSDAHGRVSGNVYEHPRFALSSEIPDGFSANTSLKGVDLMIRTELGATGLFTASHAEFTRMLGEHGIPGAIAILLVISLVIQAWKRAGPSRPITVTFLTWAIAQMFYANFRVVGIAWAFAFAFLLFLPEDGVPDDPELGPDLSGSLGLSG